MNLEEKKELLHTLVGEYFKVVEHCATRPYKRGDILTANPLTSCLDVPNRVVVFGGYATDDELAARDEEDVLLNNVDCYIYTCRPAIDAPSDAILAQIDYDPEGGRWLSFSDSSLRYTPITPEVIELLGERNYASIQAASMAMKADNIANLKPGDVIEIRGSRGSCKLALFTGKTHTPSNTLHKCKPYIPTLHLAITLDQDDDGHMRVTKVLVPVECITACKDGTEANFETVPRSKNCGQCSSCEDAGGVLPDLVRRLIGLKPGQGAQIISVNANDLEEEGEEDKGVSTEDKNKVVQ